VRRSAGAIMHRLRQRLISHSVGRRRLGEKIDGPLPYSWCAGFRVLNGRRFVASQLRRLDRGREKQMRRVQRALRRAVAPGTGARKGTGHTPLEFYGGPFSYSKQFRRASSAVVGVGAGGRGCGGLPGTGRTGVRSGSPRGKSVWQRFCALARWLWRLIRSCLYDPSPLPGDSHDGREAERDT
jgi:hypothetical protein